MSRLVLLLVIITVMFSALAIFVVIAGGVIAGVDCDVTLPTSKLGCDAKDLLKATADARALLVQILTGVGGIGVLYFVWSNYTHAQVSAKETRSSDNYIKAVEQLGHVHKHVRIGGIYGLQRLLKTASTDGDYWTIMDVLTAYVRDNSPQSGPPRTTQAPEDIQAAINVLARRFVKRVPDREGTDTDSPVDLHNTDLSGLWMSDGHFEHGNFENSYFSETALEAAYLQNASFTNVDLRLAKTLRNAKLKNAPYDPKKAPSDILEIADFSTDPAFSGQIVRNMINKVRIYIRRLLNTNS